MVTENDPRPVLRQELSRVFKNQRVIRAFEKIFDLIPPEFINQQILIDTATLTAELANAQSNEAVAAATRLASALEMFATAPLPVSPLELDLGILPPPNVANPYPHIERGVWTPADASGAGLAITVDSAEWVKHEDLVIARADITYPATASGLSSLLSGLPFTVANVQANRQGFISYATVATANFCLPTANNTTIAFYTNVGAATTNAQLTGANLYFMVIYSVLP